MYKKLLCGCVVLVAICPDVSAAEAFLGVTVRVSQATKVAGSAQTEVNGVKVIAVTRDGPADKGGLKIDDIIQKVGDKEVQGLVAFVKLIGAQKPGQKVTFHLLRDGKNEARVLTIGTKPDRPKE